MKKAIYPQELHVKISDRLAASLTAAAIRNNTTESEITRQALKDFLKWKVDKLMGEDV